MKTTAIVVAVLAALLVPVSAGAKSTKMTRVGAELAVAEKVERVYRRTVDGGFAEASCRKITSRYYDCEYTITQAGFSCGYRGDCEEFAGTASVRKPKGAKRWVVRVSRPR